MSPLPAVPPADGYNHLTKLDGSFDVKLRAAPVMRQSIEVKSEVIHFDGRKWPLAYFGEHTDETWDVEFVIDTVKDGDQWGNLRAILDGAQRGNVLVWTDVFGAQFHCVVSTDPSTREMMLGGVTGQFARVALKITRVE